MKCIVIETSPERTNAHPVTNEDGTPHIYATMGEARAELKANGYSYNRANARYYFADAPEYRAYIIREDTEEYAEATKQNAEPEPAQVAAEAESLKDVDAYAHDAKTNANAAAWALDRITKDHRETAAELARFARTCADLAKDAADNAAASYEHARRTYYADYQTSTYAAQALAIRAEQRDDAQKEAQRAEETAQKVEALATIEDPKQREYYAAEAIAHQWSAEETAQNLAYVQEISAANAAALALLSAYAEAIGEYPDEDDDETHAAYLVARDDLTGTSQRASEYDRETVELMTEAIARAARPADLSKYENMKYLEFDQPEPAPLYQRYELLAYLGDPDAYDVEAIEAEATRFTTDGARVWSAFGEDLAAIAERHELFTYYAI